MDTTISPVPKDQIPTKEFEELSESWFFSIPLKGNSNLRKFVFLSWIVVAPISLLITSSSYSLKNNITSILLLTFTTSLVIPLLILVRQLVGWDYILRRLTATSIEYEESGWYDGQTWEKPVEWRSKDLLIATHDVKPIVLLLINYLKVTILLLSTGLGIYIFL